MTESSFSVVLVSLLGHLDSSDFLSSGGGTSIGGRDQVRNGAGNGTQEWHHVLFRALFLHNWLRPKCPGTHEGTDYSKGMVHNQLGMVHNQLGYASGQCHKRREGGMRPSKRHSGDTESLSQSLERWGQAAESRLPSLLRS